MLNGRNEEVVTGTVNIGLHNDVDSSDTVELNLLIGVLGTRSHGGHVLTLGVVLLVSLSENSVLGEASRKSKSLGGFLPGVVVEASLDVLSVLVVSVEPNVCSYPSAIKLIGMVIREAY